MRIYGAIDIESATTVDNTIVMNNNGNTVSDLAILGRIPFKGNKDILEFFKNDYRLIIIDSAQYRNVKDISIIKGD